MDTPMPEPDASGAQSVDRALALLKLIASSPSGEMAMTAITAASGLMRPTARRLLLALIRAGLVEQGAEGAYALGPEALALGASAARQQNLLDAAMDSLRILAAESGDTSFVSARRNTHAVCLHREEGDFPVRTHVLQAGSRHPLGVGAGAMAILMALPDAQVERILAATRAEVAEHFPDFTEAYLRGELAEARLRGWAVNPGKYVSSSWAIGVAIMGAGGVPVGSLSISAIDARLSPERQATLATLLQREARQVEARLRAAPLPITAGT